MAKEIRRVGNNAISRSQSGQNKPVHVIWGIPKGKDSPAVLVTAYRPDPERWSDDFLGRRL
jgi:hypothetical protein